MEGQTAALVALHAALKIRKLGWLELASHLDASRCEGLSVGATGAVCGIDLSDNLISAELPSFAAFSELRALRLYDNQIAGVLPSFAQNAELAELYADDNQFRGTVVRSRRASGLARAQHPLIGCH
jgi:hypothetical protein